MDSADFLDRILRFMESSRGHYNLRLGENPARRVNNRIATLEADCTGVNASPTERMRITITVDVGIWNVGVAVSLVIERAS